MKISDEILSSKYLDRYSQVQNHSKSFKNAGGRSRQACSSHHQLIFGFASDISQTQPKLQILRRQCCPGRRWTSNLRESRFSRISPLDLKVFQFHFHSRSWFWGIFISLFILKKSERKESHFLFLETKMQQSLYLKTKIWIKIWKCSKFIDSQEFARNVTSQSWSIFISLFILEMSEPDFQFTFHLSKKMKEIYFSLSLLGLPLSKIHSRRTLRWAQVDENGWKYPPYYMHPWCRF